MLTCWRKKRKKNIEREKKEKHRKNGNIKTDNENEMGCEWYFISIVYLPSEECILKCTS